ncbi:KH domain-containing protein [bacterium]|nr:KH domain-containing protein [bacterium]
MVDFIRFVVRNLVDSPDSLEVKEIEGETTTIVEITVAKSDVGHVIGKQGKIINALREVVRSNTRSGEKKVQIEVV